MAFPGHILPGMGAVAVARDRDDRDAAIERFDEAGHQVGCPRAERRIANTGAVGDPGISVSGKGAAALVVDQMMVQPDNTHRVVKRQKLEPAHAEHRPGARQTQHLGDRPPPTPRTGRAIWQRLGHGSSLRFEGAAQSVDKFARTDAFAKPRTRTFLRDTRARERRKQTNSSRNALRLLTLPHKRIATWLDCVSTPA